MESIHKDQALNTLVKGAGFVYMGLIFSKVFTYLYRIIIARIGVEEYGLFSLGIAVTSIAMYVPLLGLDQGIIRYVSYHLGFNDLPRIKGTITSALKIAAPLSILSLIILYLSANYIAIDVLKEPRLADIIKILSFAIPFYVFSELFLSIIKAYKRMDYWVGIRNIFENLIKFTITYLLISTGFGAIGAAIGFTIANIISLILAVVIVEIKIMPLLKSKIVSIKHTTQLVTYSWPIMFNILFGQIYGWTDTLLLGYFKSTTEVGIYNAALPTAQIISIVPTGIMALFCPIMTNLYAQKKVNEFIDVYKTSTKWIVYMIIYVYLISVVFSKEILSVLFGPSYESGAYAFIIISTGFFVYSFLGATDLMLKVIDRTKLLMMNTLISTIINVGLNIILIPEYGILGGAIASATSISIWSILCVVESYYITKVHPFKKGLLRLIVAGISTGIIIYLLKAHLGLGGAMLLKGMVITAIVYISLIILSGCLDNEDRNMLSTIKNKIKRTIFNR
ncbi:MAG: flippase [Candidatus Woesearchaeota archaeon]